MLKLKGGQLWGVLLPTEGQGPGAAAGGANLQPAAATCGCKSCRHVDVPQRERGTRRRGSGQLSCAATHHRVVGDLEAACELLLIGSDSAAAR